MNKIDLAAGGLALCYLVHDGEELLTYRESSRWALGRLPERVALPEGVLRALEDPPLGGPVAGIAAGLTILEQNRPTAELTGILTCDAPASWRALPALHRALLGAGRDLEGVCTRDGDHTQYLLGLYNRRALAAATTTGGTPLRDVAVRRVLGSLRVATLALPHGIVRDLDTWAEVRAWDTDLPE